MSRILQFMADGSAGGGATVVLGLVEDLRRDHEVHVLVESGSYVGERTRELGTTLHEGSFFRSRTDPEASRRVQEVVSKVNPDIIHYHGGRALFYGRAVEHPAVAYTVHGYHFLHRGFVDRFLGSMAERSALKHVREIVFVCDYDRQLGVRSGLVPRGMRTRVVYNGVDIPPESAVQPDLKQIAYLNRLVYQKDPLLAVEVMRELASEGFRMAMIGGGEMEPEVRASAKGLESSIDFLGSVPRERAMQITRDSGAMLMTSRWEGLPLAPLEAMAMGVPVVAPRVSGIPEIVDSGVNGELVATRDPADFAKAIRKVCSEGEDRDRLTASAREKVERVFSWKTCLAGYRDLYSSLAAP